MAIDKADDKTKDIFDSEETEIIKEALTFYAERLARKASADAPKTIRELWAAEVQKVNNLFMKVNK